MRNDRPRLGVIDWVCPSPRVATMRVAFVSRPWQRLRRFALRGLIIVVLLIGAWLAWIIFSAQIHARRWRRSNAQAPGSNSTPSGRPGILSRVGNTPFSRGQFVELLGVDYFEQVTEVRFTGKVTDADGDRSRDSSDFSDCMFFHFPLTVHGNRRPMFRSSASVTISSPTLGSRISTG